MTAVSMTKKEFSRLEVVMTIVDGQMTVDQAAGLLGLSRRQIFRLLGGFRSIGPNSLASKRRGAPSNNRLHPAVRQMTTPTSARHSPPKSSPSSMIAGFRERPCVNG